MKGKGEVKIKSIQEVGKVKVGKKQGEQMIEKMGEQ